MKLIIAGSRETPILLKNQIGFLVKFHGWDVDEVVSGLCRGPDLWGKEWAIVRKIPCKEFPADWNTHGKKAGILRNIEMADYADALLAFWDFKSSGTAHMIKQMKTRNKQIFICGFGAKSKS